MIMEIPENIKTENEAVVRLNYAYKRMYAPTARFRLLAGFCGCFQTILSVGCAGYEPVLIKATAACDVVALSEQFLREQGWQGDFFVCSCDAMPCADKSFDVSICSEVIEHLPEFEQARKTFLEMDRISRNWIITTPCNPIGPKNTEKSHKRAFTRQDLENLSCFANAKIYKDDIYFYVVKTENATASEIFDRHFTA